MEKQSMRIGLALSGGGMRAAVFHLGILQALAEEGLLQQVSRISTVSGASLCMGLIYSLNQQSWPTNSVYLDCILPAIKSMITTKDIQWTALCKLLLMPHYWDNKVDLLSNVIEKKWGIHCCLQDIPTYPLWIINTTAFETGKDFRISPIRMGTKSASVLKPQFQLSRAMGASAGFPVLIGPYKLKTHNYNWVDHTGNSVDDTIDPVLHLWDGGVYDNMGLDPIFKIKNGGGMSNDINYMIVSNASGNIGHQRRHHGYSLRNLKRLLDINMDQVGTIKSTLIIDYMKQHHNGVYLKIGTSVSDIVKESDLSFVEKERLIHEAMLTKDVVKVRDYKTTLERVTPEDYHKIIRHGYETARANLLGWGHIH